LSGKAAASAEVAAFDFDGTLTRGGSVWQFLATVRGPLPVLSAAAGILPLLAKGALFGGTHADKAKEALFVKTLAGLDARAVAAQAAQFGVEHYRSRARADVRARLDWHRARGHRVVLVSASPVLYVGPVAAQLGADAAIATRLEVDESGLLTGRYEGGNCRGAVKAARLAAWIGEETNSPDARGIRASRETFITEMAHKALTVWAYGNSAGDLALLSFADVGVDVGRLGRLGKLRRFLRLAEVNASAATASAAADPATADPATADPAMLRWATWGSIDPGSADPGSAEGKTPSAL
jgi:phosphatidylglycerophosphatase C